MSGRFTFGGIAKRSQPNNENKRSGGLKKRVGGFVKRLASNIRSTGQIGTSDKAPSREKPEALDAPIKKESHYGGSTLASNDELAARFSALKSPRNSSQSEGISVMPKDISREEELDNFLSESFDSLDGLSEGEAELGRKKQEHQEMGNTALEVENLQVSIESMERQLRNTTKRFGKDYIKNLKKQLRDEVGALEKLKKKPRLEGEALKAFKAEREKLAEAGMTDEQIAQKREAEVEKREIMNATQISQESDLYHGYEEGGTDRLEAEAKEEAEKAELRSLNRHGIYGGVLTQEQRDRQQYLRDQYSGTVTRG